MATPRDPVEPAAPTGTTDERAHTSTEPAVSDSGYTENTTGSPGSQDQLPAGEEEARPSRDSRSEETDEAQGDNEQDTNSPTTAPPDNTPTDDDPENTEDEDASQTTAPDGEEQEAADGEHIATDSGNAATLGGRTTSLPIRTSSTEAGPEPEGTSTQPGSESSSTPRRRTSSRSTRQFVSPDGQLVSLESIMFPRRSSSIRQSTSHQSPSSRRRSLHQPLSPPQERWERPDGSRQETPEFVLPRWQPDAEVTLCPICNTQFSIWVRKHHCRKCGRVVCSSCSPHRIIIPNQYIVRPPGSELSFASSLFQDPMGATYLDADGVPGGERVRLCNPCVPDPNTAPPHSPAPLSPRAAHHRSRSSLSSAYGGMPAPGRYGGLANALQAVSDAQNSHSSRTRSIALSTPSRYDAVPTSSRSASYQAPFDRYMSMRPGNSSAQFTTRPGLFEDGGSSSRHRALPPTPQIAEEDECPVCHRELPATTLPDFETLREQHITACIQSHSTYGSPAPGSGVPASPPVARRSGMYTYAATEKDCVDDAECTICLEEFAVGVPMARLECLCRFHRACIAAWFVNHPGRCPVHQHDGFGF